MAGTVVGQPPRKRLKVDDDPFGAVGDYAGSFLIKSAVELSGGYDTNPGRLPVAEGIAVLGGRAGISRRLRLGAPRAGRRSQGIVHRLWRQPSGHGRWRGLAGADQYRPAEFQRSRRRPSRCHRKHPSDSQRRGCWSSTDNPGSPNIQAGLARYPVYTTFGGTFGFDQKFNRLEISAGATVDRTVYQDSTLTDGTTSTNDDRNFNQYGGVGRVSYELTPGVKPFVEVEGDTRVHDLPLDRNGYARNSTGGYAKGGTSFEFSRLLTGEISVGWASRDYVDPRLGRLDGLLTAGSLVWTATPLTTAKFVTSTSIDETIVPGVSGVLTHLYTVEVDHDFRRWLTAIGKFTYGTLDYQGDGRFDKIYSIEGDLIYKMTRSLWIKGTLRRDMLNSNFIGSSSASTVVMLGVRVQN